MQTKRILFNMITMTVLMAVQTGLASDDGDVTAAKPVRAQRTHRQPSAPMSPVNHQPTPSHSASENPPYCNKLQPTSRDRGCASFVIPPMLIAVVAKGGSYVMKSKFGCSEKKADISCAVTAAGCTVAYPLVTSYLKGENKGGTIDIYGHAWQVLINQAVFWAPNILTALKSRIWAEKKEEAANLAQASNGSRDSQRGRPLSEFLNQPFKKVQQ